MEKTQITASVCTIGDEILIGQIVDTNSSAIATALNEIGVKVRRMISIADDREQILTSLENELKDNEIVIVTGGLGPTDDYITKPFLPLEMVARVKAQLRRYKHYNSGTQTDDVITYSGLVINTKTHECTLNGKALSLTPTEFSILRILCQKKGEVVSSEELFHEIWGDEYFSKSNNTITVHIRHLREKMDDSFENPKYIKTVWGCGYKIEK